ncbi:MAG: hypothetical protein PHX57_13575 [Desulfobulbaceae bacterium]|nr:hypothetical protein [Desulfobulbaceae bacterium]
MTCWTSFFNKAALLIALLLLAGICGCARYRTEITVFIPSPGETEKETEAGGREEAAPLPGDILIAVLPVENVSATDAPLDAIEQSIRIRLARSGFRLLDGAAFEQFRKKNRMRYIGGLNGVLGEAMQRELGVDAVLITSLEAYRETDPPQISLIARLVASGPNPEIIWIDSIGLSGDESRGLLDLKLIRDPGVLLDKAVDGLIGSMVAVVQTKPSREGGHLSFAELWKTGGGGTATPSRLNRKYLPYDYFRSPLIDPEKEYAVAVLPMLDLAVRKQAGIIAQLHYVRELFNSTDFNILEPGVVREGLLEIRAIMPFGPSLAETDLITSDQLLGVDLVFAGKVFDYQNTSFNPKVDFSMQVIEKTSRRVVFGTRTFSTGLDRVFFYDFGRVYTAHNLLREMAKVTVQLLTAPPRRWEEPEDFIVHRLPWRSEPPARNYVMVAAAGGGK